MIDHIGIKRQFTVAFDFDVDATGLWSSDRQNMHLNCSIYGSQQASNSLHRHEVIRLKSPKFERSLADPCLSRLIEEGSISVIAVIDVDDVFAAGRKERCDRFCEDLNHQAPINNLWQAAMVYRLPLSPKQGRGFIDNLTKIYCGTDGQEI